MKFKEMFKPTKLKIILAIILFLYIVLIVYLNTLKISSSNYLILGLAAILIYPITCLLVEFISWNWHKKGFITKRIK